MTRKLRALEANNDQCTPGAQESSPRSYSLSEFTCEDKFTDIYKDIYLIYKILYLIKSYFIFYILYINIHE